MIYSALDYYLTSSRSVPRQNYRPANRTPLRSYIYNRQGESIVPNVTKWAEIGFNPGSARNNEFFNWGLTSKFRNLKRYIDRGQPIPLGVHGVDGTTHQILAIGYKSSSVGQLQEIYVYDPNCKDVEQTMWANHADKSFDYWCKSSKKWRTYFVDKSYKHKTPVNVRSG